MRFGGGDVYFYFILFCGGGSGGVLVGFVALFLRVRILNHPSSGIYAIGYLRSFSFFLDVCALYTASEVCGRWNSCFALFLNLISQYLFSKLAEDSLIRGSLSPCLLLISSFFVSFLFMCEFHLFWKHKLVPCARLPLGYYRIRLINSENKQIWQQQQQQ